MLLVSFAGQGNVYRLSSGSKSGREVHKCSFLHFCWIKFPLGFKLWNSNDDSHYGSMWMPQEGCKQSKKEHARMAETRKIESRFKSPASLYCIHWCTAESERVSGLIREFIRILLQRRTCSPCSGGVGRGDRVVTTSAHFIYWSSYPAGRGEALHFLGGKIRCLLS